MSTALVLEDDAFSAMALKALLEDEGYVVHWFSDTDQAAAHLASESPDLLVADWQVEGSLSSAEIAQRAKQGNPDILVAFVTGYSADDLTGSMPEIGPYLHFSKPLDYDDFLEKIRH